ncbi:hypothetical protein LguiA_030655 [Lonicera macranthoides]
MGSTSEIIVEGLIKLPENMTVPAVLLFGDSIVDQGNNNHLITGARCNYLPYGKDFYGGIPTGRFSNAKTPSDLIASELGVKDTIPAYLDPTIQNKDLMTGVSFASGGTGYDPQTSELMLVYSLSDQLKMFKEYIEKLKGIVGEEGSNYILANAMFMVIAGTDDLANTYYTLGIGRLHYNLNSYTDLMVENASKFVQELYKVGVRRIGVVGVPAIGCVPLLRTIGDGLNRECFEKYNQGAQLFNKKLSSKIDSLGNSLLQSRVVYMDIYNPLLEIIHNPSIYGFEVVDRGCCGTGKIEITMLCNKITPTCPDSSKFLFWDSFHPTEKGYHILVIQILEKYISRFL